jgi:hypothetical protein
VDGRNGMFHIQKLYIWESVDHNHVYLEGIGKRGLSIRGGFLVTKECLANACREFLAELARPSGVVSAEQKTPVIKRFKMVCSECGSEQVLKDAYAIWSVEEQEWILHSTYDHADCEECGGECKVKEIVADDCQMNAEGFCSTHQKVHLRESSAAMGIPAAAEGSERVDDNPPSVFKEWNMRCPECCSDEEIEICCNIWARLHTDGTTTDDTQDGSHEWNPESPAKCRRCDFSGKVLDFEIEQFTTDEERSNGPKKT